MTPWCSLEELTGEPGGGVCARSIHALLRDLVAGGAPTALKADGAAALLRSIRPATGVERARKQLAWDLVRDPGPRRRAEVDHPAHGRRARGPPEPASGPTASARSWRRVGRCGRASRLFASYAGTAPVEASSGERIRHRLSRSGDRKLNSALHLVAVTQVRMAHSEGRRYYDRKITQGKAMRCLKRKIAGRVWRVMSPTNNNPAAPTPSAACGIPGGSVYWFPTVCWSGCGGPPRTRMSPR